MSLLNILNMPGKIFKVRPGSELFHKPFHKEAPIQTGSRVLAFILHIKETKADFQRKTGVDRGQMTRAFRNEREFGLRSLERMGRVYPYLSLDWVITGKGEMLKSDHPLCPSRYA